MAQDYRAGLRRLASPLAARCQGALYCIRETTMSWLDDIIGGGVGLIQGAFSGMAQEKANEQNIDLTKQEWTREDNAVQRRAADMQAAGINPLLAAGSPASASAPATVQPANPVGDAAGAALNNILQVAKTQADVNLAHAQTSKTASDTTGQDLSNAFAAEMNPLKLSSMQLDVQLQKDTNPTRVQTLQDQLKGIDLDNANKLIDQAVKNAGIDQTHAQTAYTAAQTRLAGQQLSNSQQDFFAKVIAVDTAGIQNDILKQLQKTNPGLADGLGKWFGIAGNVANLLK